MKDKVVMLFLDAFSSKYLGERLSPTMYKLSQEHFFSQLEPMFAFQGIGATMYSGAWSNTTGVWAEYVLGENDTRKNSLPLEKLVELADVMPNDRLCWYLRYALLKLWGKKYIGTPTLIPGKLAKYFTTKLQKNYADENSLGQLKTIFDVLRENGMDYDYVTPFPARAEGKEIDLLCKKLKKNSIPTLTLLQLSSLDQVGHSHGPNSYEMQKTVERIDEAVNNILEATRVSHDNIHIVVFSDHGMSTVQQLTNVWKILHELPITLRKDYLVFLDSTMARFWFLTHRARRYIEEAFAEIECGHILDADQLQQFHVDKLGEEHGQMIFALDDGAVIYPDFFRRHNPPKGMHGYMIPQDNPILLVCSPKNNRRDTRFKNLKKARMIDIMPTVLDLLDLQIPKTCEGDSLRV